MEIFKYILSFAVFILFILTLYSGIKGIKTKDYHNFKKYGTFYLIINFVRIVFELN